MPFAGLMVRRSFMVSQFLAFLFILLTLHVQYVVVKYFSLFNLVVILIKLTHQTVILALGDFLNIGLKDSERKSRMYDFYDGISISF